MTFVMFAKHLQAWPMAKAAEAIRELGLDGVDLTVRGNGYLKPENVARELPEAVAVFRDAGLSVPMLTTDITSIDSANAEAVLAGAAELGIRELKLGYWQWRETGGFRAAMDQAKADLRGLAGLCERYGVRGNLHLHSGRYVTANPAVVWWLLEGTDPAVLGAYLDPGHMTIEGGVDVWRQGMDLLGPRANLLAVKAMVWDYEPDADAPEGEGGRWRNRMVPLRRGNVDWVEVWRTLDHFGFDGIVSLHAEYQGGHSWRNLSTEELVEQTREDYAYLLACRQRARA